MAKQRGSVRFTALILISLLLLTLCLSLCSCGEREDDGKIKIVCTLFPQYDWLRNIVGESDAVDLSLLIKNGTDIHSYQPTAADIMEISNCDMIVYLGGEVDTWVSEALQRAEREDIKKIALTECDGVTLRNISAASNGHDHGGDDHSHGEHDGHGHGALDEHLWLSLKNAARLCETLCDALCELDSYNAGLYRSNAESYISNINELDGKYADAVASVDEHDRFMLFCDRFPFVYLIEDYGVEYSAAFEGCTTDVDADFATVLRLINELEEHSLGCVLVTEGSDRALAQTVVSSAKGFEGEILAMDSLQTVGSAQIAEGISYIAVMEENLGVMKLALGIED